MKILWVKHGKLLPVDAGGKIRTYNILRYLASRHQVELLAPYSGQQDFAYERELAGLFPGSIAISTNAPEDSDSALTQWSHYAARSFSRAPYAVEKFTSGAVRKLVTEKLDGRQFDVAVCDFLAVSHNFPTVLKTPTVLFQHNVESMIWQRQARWEKNTLKRVAFKMEAAKMNRYEANALRRFHHVIAVSESDRNLMSREVAHSQITVVPTGVDLTQFKAAKDAEPAGHQVIFLGSMDWEANIDAVIYFCDEIWPLVLSEVPDAKFRIVGRNPSPSVKRLASQSIEVTGTVPSVTEYLQAASVVVIPLRIGGGTRLKIFEAMATGKAVVSTTIGAEGLEVQDGKDIFLVDSPKEFASRVVDMLRDRTLRDRIGKAAAATASKHDWSCVAPLFEKVLAEVVASLSAPSRVRVS